MKPIYGAILLLVLAVVSASALSGVKRQSGDYPCSDLTSCLGPVTLSFEGTSCEGEATYSSFLANASDIGQCLLESLPTTYTCQAGFLNITKWNEDNCTTMSQSVAERVGICVAKLERNTSYVQLCHVNDTFTHGFPGNPILDPEYNYQSAYSCNSTTGECPADTILDFSMWQDTTCNSEHIVEKQGLGPKQNISLGGCVYMPSTQVNTKYECTDTHLVASSFNSGCDGEPYMIQIAPLGKCLISGEDISTMYNCVLPPPPPSEPVAEEPTSTPSSSEPSSPEASSPVSVPTSTTPTPVDAPSSASPVEMHLFVVIASITVFSVLFL